MDAAHGPEHITIAALILVAIGVPIVGFLIMARVAREVARIGRAVAGLVYQEEEKTRARLEELLSRPLR